MLYEWDAPDTRTDAAPAEPALQFPTVASMRECVVWSEANRVLGLYFKYVEKEHPEVVNDATFRGAEGGST